MKTNIYFTYIYRNMVAVEMGIHVNFVVIY